MLAWAWASRGTGGAVPREDEDRDEQPGGEQAGGPFECGGVAVDRGGAGEPRRPAWVEAKLAAALAKIVLSSAVPTEPPTCWEVLTIAEAIPASLFLTPRVAVENAGAKMQPIPTPVSSSPGMTWLT